MSSQRDLDIVSLEVRDVRFPTSLGGHGSDALHTDPDYSCAYVTTRTAGGARGHGLTFTCGRGTEVVVLAVRSLRRHVLGRNAADIFADFAGFWRVITNDSQMRWLGPEKGVSHLAAAAILNSLWDLRARLAGKPLWRLLVDMEPEELVSAIDFRYITDVVTRDEAVQMLREKRAGAPARVRTLLAEGYPAYTTQVGWMGYSDELVDSLCAKYLALGFTHFKVKVGRSAEDDLRRCSRVRAAIGPDNHLMIDANQAWGVAEAVARVRALAPLRPLWVEEPTAPDDVLGHAAIARALEPLDIGVATGEVCANRVLFKQLLQARAVRYCQVDAARLGGVSEVLAVYFMAMKMDVPVCPHAGGVGLCEMVQHLQYWDYASLSGSAAGLVEYVDQQHEHFTDPCVVENARYMAPKKPGYSTEFTAETLERYSYPRGSEWQRLFREGVFPPPDEAELVNC